jgi:hypothetical protein
LEYREFGNLDKLHCEKQQGHWLDSIDSGNQASLRKMDKPGKSQQIGLDATKVFFVPSTAKRTINE